MKQRLRRDQWAREGGSVTYDAVRADSLRRVKKKGLKWCTLGWPAHGIEKNDRCASSWTKHRR